MYNENFLLISSNRIELCKNIEQLLTVKFEGQITQKNVQMYKFEKFNKKQKKPKKKIQKVT